MHVPVAAAENQKQGTCAPVYVIGTELPVPGGAVESLDHLQIIKPRAVTMTYNIHRQAFAEAGQASAFSRMIAMVVQPGVEFGHNEVINFVPEKAEEPSRWAKQLQVKSIASLCLLRRCRICAKQ